MGVDRATISVRLRPGKDDDLIQWWNNEPDRAFLLRKMIREHLNPPVVLPMAVEIPKQAVKVEAVMVSEPVEFEAPKFSLKKAEGAPQEKPVNDLMSQFDD